MPDGSEFQTAGAATLKPREVLVLRYSPALQLLGVNLRQFNFSHHMESV